MSEFWARTKSGFAEAAEASKKAALKTKAKADLELLKRKLTKLKQEFGVQVFPFYESDKAKADAIYANYREQVNRVVQAIQLKQQEIENLGMKKHSSSEAEYSLPQGQQASQAPSMAEI